MKKLLSAIDSISIWTGKAFSILTIIMVLAIIYEVIMRYIFHLPTLWASEAMVFCCALIYVIGGAWTLYADQHVKVDLVYEKVTPKTRAIMDVISFFFFALYMLSLLWASATYAWDSVQLRETVGSAWNPPIYPIKVAIVVGIFLLLLQGIAKFIRDFYYMIYEKRL